MKCPICKGKMKLINDEMDNVTFEAFRCISCGEELLNSSQLRSLAGKYRKLRKAREVTFAQWGNSIAVRIPKDIADKLNIKPGSHGLLTEKKKEIQISQIKN